MTTSLYKPVAVIPHYNHAGTLPEVVRRLLGFDLSVLIVDDGSDEQNIALIRPLEKWPNVEVYYSVQNGGKGAAMKTGLQRAFTQGFSHALQVDADGQHNLADVEKMLIKSRENPTALICGEPVYGADAPKSRLYGRKLTNFWIHVNTLSMNIQDGMCGFRIYPLAQTLSVIRQEYIGNRMDFDTEILVRMYWRRIPIQWIKTAVKYEAEGISHFHGWLDNWLISKMHARLFFTMLWRKLTGKAV